MVELDADLVAAGAGGLGVGDDREHLGLDLAAGPHLLMVRLPRRVRVAARGIGRVRTCQLASSRRSSVRRRSGPVYGTRERRRSGPV